MDGNGAVSVLMAAYNAEHTIAESIRSVLAQTYGKLELIVIDDASSDSTASIVRDFAQKDQRVRLLSKAHNGGVSAARKSGLSAAAGDWIAILDSDDLWTADKLEKQMTRQRETGAELLFTGSAFIDEAGKPKDWVLHVPETVNYQTLLKQNILSNSSALVKKTLFEQFFVENDKIHEDYALWLRITGSGVCAYGVDEPLLIYRLRTASKSGNKWKSAVMNWNTYRYVGLSVPLSCRCMLRYTINGLLKYRHFHRPLLLTMLCTYATIENKVEANGERTDGRCHGR